MGILMDRGDADAMRGGRVGDERLAVHGDRAGIGRVEPGHQLDQRGFSGSVLSEQRGDFAGADIKVHIVERQHAGEGFGEAARDQHGPRVTPRGCLGCGGEPTHDRIVPL